MGLGDAGSQELTGVGRGHVETARGGILDIDSDHYRTVDDTSMSVLVASNLFGGNVRIDVPRHEREGGWVSA